MKLVHALAYAVGFWTLATLVLTGVLLALARLPGKRRVVPSPASYATLHQLVGR